MTAYTPVMIPALSPSHQYRMASTAVSHAISRPPILLIQTTIAATIAAITMTIQVIGLARSAEFMTHCAAAWASVTTFHTP